MPSSSPTATQVLLLATPDAALLASSNENAVDDCIPVPAAAPRRSVFFALLVSLLLHALAGVALWQWTQELPPAPDSHVLQIRLRSGGGKPAVPVIADQPPAPAAPLAAVPAPPRPSARQPASLPPEPAKTATLPAPAPVLASQEPETAVPTPASPADTGQTGTAVLTPPADPLVNTATIRVLEWLAQHRRYPGPARRAKLQGTVEIVVVLMPDGRLVDQRIAQSSGHAILDKAALDLLRRASPVPASAFFTGEARRLELRLPIIYRLSI